MKLVKILMIGMLICMLWECARNEQVMRQKEFTSLLIDMHVTDGILSVYGEYTPDRDKKVYSYYNELFDKYGIDRAIFDSTMHYYNSKPEVFNKIYEVVVDSLNKRLTVYNRVMNDLKARDSVNYFPVPDTLVFTENTLSRKYTINNLNPGMYRFTTMVKFDTLKSGEYSRIEARFMTKGNRDTLKVREVRVSIDTVQRRYQWSQYIDSNYTRLEIVFLDSDNLKDLKSWEAKAWNTTLFNTYLAPRYVVNQQKTLPELKDGVGEEIIGQEDVYPYITLGTGPVFGYRENIDRRSWADFGKKRIDENPVLESEEDNEVRFISEPLERLER
ncbi:MAG: DUF4296 domain-containing protein [Odoribacter sp.]|nr:DUF4296 domain-containing protein [Odoribacter sp.]